MSDMPMATALKRLRKQYGLGQKPFAAHVRSLGGDLPDGTIAVVETGRRNMSESAVDDLAGALGLSAQERADLHTARRLQAAVDAEAATATRLKAVEERLADLEDWADSMDPSRLSNRNFAVGSEGHGGSKGRKMHRPTDVEPETEDP